MNYSSIIYEHGGFTSEHSPPETMMDFQAFAKCQGHNLPIMIFNFREDGNLERAVAGEVVGTIIHD